MQLTLDNIIIAATATVLKVKAWQIFEYLVQALLLVLVALAQPQYLMGTELTYLIALEDIVLSHPAQLPSGIFAHLLHLIAVLILECSQMIGAHVTELLNVFGLCGVATLYPFYLLCAILSYAMHLLCIVLSQSLQLLTLIALDAVEHGVNLPRPGRLLAIGATG